MKSKEILEVLVAESTMFIASNFKKKELEEVKKDLVAKRAALILDKEKTKDAQKVIGINAELTKVNTVTTKINQSINLIDASEKHKKQEEKFKKSNPFAFEKHFVEVAKDFLEDETFSQIEIKARQRIGEIL